MDSRYLWGTTLALRETFKRRGHASAMALALTWLNELRRLMALALPLVAGLLTSTLMTLIDTAMLGPLGERPLAAASLTGSVLLIFIAGLWGFLSPVGILIGHAHGAARTPRIAANVRAGLRRALLLGALGALLMAALLPLLPFLKQPPDVIQALPGYRLCWALTLIPWTLSLVYKQALDAIDRPWLGVLLTLPPLALNALFNYALIYGHFGFPALGLTGAGIGTLAATCAGLLITALVCHRHRALKTCFALGWRRGHLARKQHHEGTPMGVQYVLEGGAVAVAGIFIGWLGEIALAANQIVSAVGTSLYMVPLGLAGAVSIRIAQASGAGERARLRPIAGCGLIVVSLWMLAASALMVVFAHQIAAAFVDDPQVITTAVAVFWVFGAMQLFDGWQSVSLGALRGLLDSHWPTRVSLVAYWLLSLPLSAVFGFAFDWGPAGIWAGFGLGLLVAAIALSARLHRLTKVTKA
jgi:multidrug resistance protein, MATE family